MSPLWNARSRWSASALVVLGAGLAAPPGFGSPPARTAAQDVLTLMRFPDIHDQTVVFAAAGDLWLASIGGGPARQLTNAPGLEYFPKFSPDGQSVAYTGQVDGRWQVFVIPTAGGTARQLTFYPAPFPGPQRFDNQIMDWTPDGKFVVYRSGHESPFIGIPGSIGRFYRVPAAGGWSEPLALSRGAALSYSADGTRIAFTRVGRDFDVWKRYQGGRAEDIWIYDFGRDSLRRITNWAGTDNHPMWSGNRIYFVSDRSGTLNLYRYDLPAGTVRPITHSRTWDVKWPSLGPGGIVFEIGGGLYRMSLADERVAPIINVSVPFVRPATPIDAAQNIESFSLAPAGDRLLVTARGELFVTPVGSADAKNLTRSPGVRESDGSLSPDGARIAYVSDASGTEELYVMGQDGGSAVQLTSGSQRMIRRPVWSPDGRFIAVSDVDGALYIVDPASKEKLKIDRSPQASIDDYRWSPDGNWLAYSKMDRVDFTQVYLYDARSRKSARISDERFWSSGAVFGPNGRSLFYASRRDFTSPAVSISQAFEYDMAFGEMDEVYQVPLGSPPVSGDSAGGSVRPAAGAAVDLAGIADRLSRLAVRTGWLQGLRAGADALFFMRRGTLCAYDLRANREVELLPNVRSFELSADGTKLLVARGAAYAVLPASASPIDPKVADQWPKLKLEMPRNDREEWRQMLGEAWRWQKNMFFFRDMRGLDWPGVLRRYASVVNVLSNRHDLNYLIEEMIGELSVGHLGASGGDLPEEQAAPGRLLGVEFAPDTAGYFRIARIMKGENWNPQARSPLSEPGVRAGVGNYVLEIDGQPLRLPDSPYRLLAQSRDPVIVLTLNEIPRVEGAWKVRVRSIPAETPLRYIEWVASNQERVARATNGRVGYVHVPSFTGGGMIRFMRAYLPHTDREALIVDGRYNTGGFLAEAALERLRRRAVGMNICRGCGTWTYPKAAFSGAQVLLENEYAVSDGDLFPYFYRKYGLGPIVGGRTWGTVIGAVQRQLMDGGRVAAAGNAVTNLDLVPEPENVGVAPDVAVDNPPNEEAKGRDAQLDKAITIVLERLKRQPVRRHPIPGSTGRD